MLWNIDISLYYFSWLNDYSLDKQALNPKKRAGQSEQKAPDLGKTKIAQPFDKIF